MTHDGHTFWFSVMFFSLGIAWGRTRGIATADLPRAVRRKTTWASSSAAISLAMFCK